MQEAAAALKCCPNFHHLTLSGMDHIPLRALATLLQQGPRGAVGFTVGLRPASPTSAPVGPSVTLLIFARFNRVTVFKTTDVLDAAALRFQQCTTIFSWVDHLIGVALTLCLHILLLLLTERVLPGITQSQQPLHLLWLAIELWLSAGGCSRCFPLLHCLRNGFRCLRLFLVFVGLPLRMLHKSVPQTSPFVVLAILVTQTMVLLPVVPAQADITTLATCMAWPMIAVYCCWSTFMACLWF